jgi:hypothetical protein
MLEDALRFALTLIIGIPLLSFVVTLTLTAAIAAAWVLGSMVMYVVGIPLAIAYRVKTGEWPR